MLAWGPVPPGKIVRHTCDNPPCVNPLHLMNGTSADNSRDMVLRGRTRPWNEGKTHCIRGHEFTPENTLTWGTKRACRTCKQKREAERYLRRKLEAEQ
jgi:hypothetical protein